MRKYRVNYSETEEYMVNTCRMQSIDGGKIIPPFVAGLGGIAVMFAMFQQNIPQTYPAGMGAFFVKFVIWWVVALAVLELFFKTFGKKLMLLSAEGTGHRLYDLRMDKREEPLEMSADFYDDHFTFTGANKDKTYRYDEVVRLLESVDLIGIVVRVQDGRKMIYSFPKNEVTVVETGEMTGIGELKDFLAEKCTGVKKKFEWITYSCLLGLGKKDVPAKKERLEAKEEPEITEEMETKEELEKIEDLEDN